MIQVINMASDYLIVKVLLRILAAFNAKLFTVGTLSNFIRLQQLICCKQIYNLPSFKFLNNLGFCKKTLDFYYY